jgi:hypothetical protein
MSMNEGMNGQGMAPSARLSVANGKKPGQPAPEASLAKVPGGFVPSDPRRWSNGSTNARALEIRRLMVEDVPAARQRLLELVRSEDERVAVQAIALAYAYGIGKPRTAPEDIEAILRVQFREALDKLGQRLPPAVFAQVMDALR